MWRQELADEVDMQLQQLRQIEPTLIPFGSWVLAQATAAATTTTIGTTTISPIPRSQTLGAMRRFLTLGFELDLYAPCEYRMVYWYARALTPPQRNDAPQCRSVTRL